MPKKVEVTTNEARQATTRPRAMIWVLLGSLFLCAMAGFGLAMGWISLHGPVSGSKMPVRFSGHGHRPGTRVMSSLHSCDALCQTLFGRKPQRSSRLRPIFPGRVGVQHRPRR